MYTHFDCKGNFPNVAFVWIVVAVQDTFMNKKKIKELVKNGRENENFINKYFHDVLCFDWHPENNNNKTQLRENCAVWTKTKKSVIKKGNMYMISHKYYLVSC